MVYNPVRVKRGDINGGILLMTTYIVQPGESIWDVTVNATGTLAGLDAVLDANGFTDWTPDLVAGSSVIIPNAAVLDLNALRQIQTYKICNTSVNDIATKINTIFEILKNFWILTTGFWNDDALWIDKDFWID